MRKMMNLTALACTLALLAGPSRAEDSKTLAIVVKGLDNPFFDLIRQGCEKAQAELKGGYKCYYTGPASTSDEAGEVQIIEDLLTKGVAAMAISPSNAPAVANLLRQRKPTIPIMTIDADLLPQDHSLRRTYMGTDNYLLGVKLAEHLKTLKPHGGTVCLLLGNVAADNINQRAAGTRDTLAGKKGVERLNGENGWKEISGCPLFTNDDAAKGNQMMADVLTANKDLDAFVLEGGSIHVDGEGTVITTEQCLLNPNRNPGLGRAEVEANLRDWLGVSRVIWLAEGLENDHTDGHVDDITCFVRPGVVLTATCADPADANHRVLEDNLRRLRAARDARGSALEIIELPLPARRDTAAGRKSAFAKATILVAEELTLSQMTLVSHENLVGIALQSGGVTSHTAILARAFPGRRIIQVPALDIVEGGGGIHCITQQQPAGRPASR